MRNATLAAAIAMALPLPSAWAQEAPAGPMSLGEIIVTAQRREERIQDVPVAVSTVSGGTLDAIRSGGDDIRFLAARLPSLNIESSFDRSFPRFYIRGLGNTDFDLNASQPVSLVYDDVVQESPILKGGEHVFVHARPTAMHVFDGDGNRISAADEVLARAA